MKKFITLFIILISFSLNAQSNPEQIIEDFFSDYQSKGVVQAIDNIYASNPWINTQTDAIINLKNKMSDLTEEYIGKLHGRDLITKKEFSDKYVIYTYLVRYDRQPVRFTFEFYKPKNEWRIHSFKYNGDEFESELEELTRLYNLDLENKN
ncbi:hypothetical protein [Dokdonia sp. PRO95]|uniref:hypothetical protein n=1 Tax=unclassified Dokdonia TaxID=2615033 RepID=UPI000555F6B1|nr:hypothetical protein [Dokdonia sp. PRO95]